MTEQLDIPPQIESESVLEKSAREHAGTVTLDRLVEKVRDEAIDGIPVVRDQVDVVRNLMNRGGLRRFTSRTH